MPDYYCLLITVVYQESMLLKAAIRIPKDAVSYDCIEYPLEPENRVILQSLLPDHIRSCGPIVDVDEIFDVVVL